MPSDREILAAAAEDALRAPSPFNTQPWTWRVTDTGLDLYADRDRQLTVIDPHGKLVLLAGGIALHHARTSVAAAGYTATVERFVTSLDDDLLARLTIGTPRAADDSARAWRDAIPRRRTDRRPFADQPVTEQQLDALAAVASAEGAVLHVVREGQMPMLSVATAQAAEVEMSDPDYRLELIRWTNRPVWSGDGVLADTTVQQVPRRVPVRTLAVEPNAGMPIAPDGDRGAAYVIVSRDGDGPTDWFAAGEAASAVLLAATALGLSTAPITDVIEVAHPRDLVRSLLPAGRHPFLVVRCGWPGSPEPLPDAPRRDPIDAIITTTSA